MKKKIKQITIVFILIVVLVVIMLLFLGHFNLIRKTEEKIIGIWRHTSCNSDVGCFSEELIFNKDGSMVFLYYMDIDDYSSPYISYFPNPNIKSRKITSCFPSLDDFAIERPCFNLKYSWTGDVIYRLEDPGFRRTNRFERVESSLIN